MVTSDVLL